jgi:hypothetical protein
LFIVGTAAGALSAAAAGGNGPEGPNYVADAAARGNGLTVGALLILVMSLSLAFIPVVMFPLLTSVSPRLAAGYLAFRGALETTSYMILVVTWLTLAELGREYASQGADADGLATAGSALARVGETTFSSITPVFFLAGATIFYSALWRARLVPRWLSGWGLVAVIPYLAQAMLAFFGKGASTESMLVAPLALQELVLAVWLIVRGFRELDR